MNILEYYRTVLWYTMVQLEHESQILHEATLHTQEAPHLQPCASFGTRSQPRQRSKFFQGRWDLWRSCASIEGSRRFSSWRPGGAPGAPKTPDTDDTAPVPPCPKPPRTPSVPLLPLPPPNHKSLPRWWPGKSGPRTLVLAFLPQSHHTFLDVTPFPIPALARARCQISLVSS